MIEIRIGRTLYRKAGDGDWRESSNGQWQRLLSSECRMLDEIERLRAIVDRLTESIGLIGDKLGSVIRTIPANERSDVFIRAIDAANRIAFTDWKWSVDSTREAAKKARTQ